MGPPPCALGQGGGVEFGELEGGFCNCLAKSNHWLSFYKSFLYRLEFFGRIESLLSQPVESTIKGWVIVPWNLLEFTQICSDVFSAQLGQKSTFWEGGLCRFGESNEKSLAQKADGGIQHTNLVAKVAIGSGPDLPRFCGVLGSKPFVPSLLGEPLGTDTTPPPSS